MKTFPLKSIFWDRRINVMGRTAHVVEGASDEFLQKTDKNAKKFDEFLLRFSISNGAKV